MKYITLASLETQIIVSLRSTLATLVRSHFVLHSRLLRKLASKYDSNVYEFIFIIYAFGLRLNNIIDINDVYIFYKASITIALLIIGGE